MMWSGAWIADYPEGDNNYYMDQMLGKGTMRVISLWCSLHSGHSFTTATTSTEKLNRQIEADNPWIIHVTVIGWYAHKFRVLNLTLW